MKLLMFFLIVTYLQVSAAGYAQQVTLKKKNTSLEKVFEEIYKQTGYQFVYTYDVIQNANKISIDAKDTPIKKVLATCFQDQPFTYTLMGKAIVLKKKESGRMNEGLNVPPFNRLIIMNTQSIIKGIVKDQLGNPLVGVSIQVIGTTNGTITDANGRYAIEVEPTDSLNFSYIGYMTQVLAVKNHVDLNVIMIAKDGSLNQIVVIGYGKQKKISMVGSQSSVNVEDIKLPVGNLSTVLAGRLAGVVSVQRSGLPGANGADIWIRGISTFSSSLSKPLVLVDGVPRTFSDIDPEDIASFSILKDAAATAVYGVRGANGVVLITTKRGKIGKPTFKFRYNEGITSFTRLPEFAGGVTYMKMVNEASETRGNAAVYSQEDIKATKDQTDPDLHPNVDWFDKIFNKYGHTRNANLNINGGSQEAQYYVGLSYYDETGQYRQDSLQKYNSQARYKRYNLTSNLTVRPTTSTTIELGVRGYLANVNYPGTATGTIFGDAYQGNPIDIPAVLSDGKMTSAPDYRLRNSYAELTQTGYTNQWASSLASNLKVTQNLDFLTKGLSISGKFAFDAYNITNMKRTKEPDTYLAIGRDSSGNLIEQLTNPGRGTRFLAYSSSKSGNRTLYNEVALNYLNSFGKHDVSGMLLFNQSDELNTQASDLITSLPYRFRGLAGRATYGYDNIYFLEFDFGYNGSENFAPRNRYGFFPSIGAGWVISKEKFFKPLQNAIQLFKLRFSYGTVGNSNISGRRFAYIATVNDRATGYIFGKNMDNSYRGVDVGEYASDVTWETSKKTNLGVNMEALNGSLSLQADLFKEHRTGIFLRRNSLPYYIGLTNNPYGNVGIVDNHGIDGTITWNGHMGEFRFQFIGNFTWNRNKVIEDDKPPYKYPWMEGKGQKVSQQFGYIALGLFKDQEEIDKSPVQNGNVLPGDLKFKDINGDNKIDAYDVTPIGYGNIPEMVYGLGFSFGYKAFNISGLFQGVGNVSILVGGAGLHPFSEGLGVNNLLSNITDRWTTENPSQNVFYPRLMGGALNDNYNASTWWLKNGKYVRLKNIQLSYQLPEAFLKRVHLKKANLFVEGVNVLTFSPFKLYDVELGNGKGANYPNTKTFAAGMGFTF